MNHNGVAVVLPCYNREKSVGEAAKSVLEQSYSNLELIIVDDGSDDGSFDVACAVADHRTLIVRNKSKGVSSARNFGVEQISDAEWIAFQDSDDIWLPGKLKKQMNQLVESNFVAGYCGMLLEQECKGEFISKKRIPSRDISKLNGDILPSLVKTNFISTQMLVVRKDTFLKVGGFDENLQALVDWELMLRIAQEGDVAFLDEDLVIQRFSPNSITKSTSRRRDAQEYILKKHYLLLKRYPGIISHHHHRLSGAYRLAGDWTLAARHAAAALRKKPYDAKYLVTALFYWCRSKFG